MRRAVTFVSSFVRYDEKLLLGALGRVGLAVDHLDDRQFVAHLTSRNAPRGGVVVNRSPSATRRRYVAHAFEAVDARVVNSASIVETCDDKVLTTLRLVAHSIPVPECSLALSPDGGIAAIAAIGYPAVVKPTGGSWGRLVGKVNDHDAASLEVGHRAEMPAADRPMLVQQFVDKPGRDIRAIVIDGELIACIYRYSSDFRTNVARGATATACAPTDELTNLALASADAVGGGALAVDLLETRAGELLVNEVNATMEFRGATEATGVDIAAAFAAYVLKETNR